MLAFAGLAYFLFRRGGVHIAERWPDFEYFYKAGAWMLAHGGLDAGYDLSEGGGLERRGSIDWYLPFTHRAMTLFAWAPFVPAGAVWLILNLIAMFASLRMMGRYMMDLPRRDWPLTQLVPFLLLIAYWTLEYDLNQINNFTMLFLVASFVLWQRGRKRIAGFWLGLAVLIKLTPMLLLVWFGLKREMRVVSAALLTIVLAGPVSDVIVFGPQDAASHYAGWARRAVHSGSHRGLILEQREMDWRNQGMGAVLSRWLHPSNWATHYDNEPRADFRSDTPAYFNIASLTRAQVAWIATAVAALSVLGLVFLARHPARDLTAWQLRMEWSLFMLAMLWLMPVMRQYHMIWAAPAMTMLAAGIHHVGHRKRWSLLAFVCIAGVIVGQLALFSKLLKAMGVTFASVAILALPIVVMLLILRRNPAFLDDAARPGAATQPASGDDGQTRVATDAVAAHG